MNYRIGQLAKLTGCNIETLRYYEREGLMPPPARGSNGYRYYNRDAVDRVNFILRAKGLGFSLKDIVELLAIRVDKHASTCGDVKHIAEHKLAAIEDKLAELNRMKAALEHIAAACCGGPMSADHCTILQALERGEPRAIADGDADIAAEPGHG